MDSAGERFAAIQEALADRKNILTVKELCELAGVSLRLLQLGAFRTSQGNEGAEGPGRF